MTPGAGTRHRLLQGFRIDVTDIHQFCLCGVFFQRIEVIGRNAATAHQREADLAAVWDFYGI